MVTSRLHRMTELFGRLAPGANLDQARAELRTVYGAMTKAHAEAYPPKGKLPDQRQAASRPDHPPAPGPCCWCCSQPQRWSSSSRAPTSPTMILTRTVRREGELATRAALGASTGALRRMLLAESLLLCGAGAAVGVWSAQPLVTILAPLRLALLGPRARFDG